MECISETRLPDVSHNLKNIFRGLAGQFLKNVFKILSKLGCGISLKVKDPSMSN